ncbi:MAG TPA: carbohydrate kinase family protein [Bacteroidales bacterium]|jgi:sugar/nucleoside kinase (ribokinase family)|nr:carbohydrate kinase family protein [Bacteroidales bacterium]HQH23679.1 carbohydrate kinase family protein [Bacteroidales bacterium]HQJ82315.1 carbohydrate kinase family protein [Bacteroidales bacterium]
MVAGHICLDITPVFRTDNYLDIQQVFTPGHLTNMMGVKIAAGGVVPNVGISLSIMGLNCQLIGKIGKDFFGEDILNFLKQLNVSESIVRTTSENTSYTVVIAPPGVDRIFFQDSGANNKFTYDDINFEIVKKARLFLFG